MHVKTDELQLKVTKKKFHQDRKQTHLTDFSFTFIFWDKIFQFN